MFDIYKVVFDEASHECRCDCNMFQSKGIVCCHMLSTFSKFRVNEVPTCYILPRWSKNVRRKHTYIKSNHDINRSDESHNLFRELRSHFYNVAQDFLRNREEAMILRSSMDNAVIKLGEHRAAKLQSSIPVQQNCEAQGTQCSISVDRLQGPALVSTVYVLISKAMGRLI
ncbi:hypothetical protein PIB30_012430 [Stylosanthes scabra]|uniref:Protein FAR1-RELATED SEQUENCE n=1 Tax=Stylosanthes scabra TaxID=79078 RepID=A0ABU6S616_9FABA|nr:hypothetical protein [Stylosanthes scabra]